MNNQYQMQQQQHPQQVQAPKNKALSALAARLNIDETEVQNIVMRTLVSAKGNQQPTAEEFVTFLAIANEYKLNPLTKEIYAFSNRGTIQPIVSVDGWLSIINGHPQFDGMEFTDSLDDNGGLISVTCSIYRKDRNRPTQVTEYMNECKGTSEPWKKWPARMLRHKAAIQAARYAFGLSGIYDPDEADRIQSVKVINPIEQPEQTTLQQLPEARLERFISSIKSGEVTADQLIPQIESRYSMSSEQKQQLLEA
jgi:phage recombination protein Bet